MPNISVTTSAYPQHKDITLVSVKGFIDTTTVSEFEKTFQTVLSEKKFNLIIDLKEVNYISSVGWGIFIGEIKRIRSQKGDLFLVSMGPDVSEAYELLELDSILKNFSSVEQAVQTGFSRSQAAPVSEKTRLKKTLEKPRKGKSLKNTPLETTPEQTQPEKNQEQPAVEKLPETAPAASQKKSQGWVKVLKPWTWF